MDDYSHDTVDDPVLDTSIDGLQRALDMTRSRNAGLRDDIARIRDMLQKTQSRVLELERESATHDVRDERNDYKLSLHEVELLTQPRIVTQQALAQLAALLNPSDGRVDWTGVHTCLNGCMAAMELFRGLCNMMDARLIQRSV